MSERLRPEGYHHRRGFDGNDIKWTAAELKQVDWEKKRGAPLTSPELATLMAFSRGFTRDEICHAFSLHGNTLKYREKCIRVKLDFGPLVAMGRVVWRALELGVIPGPASMGFALWAATRISRGDAITKLIADELVKLAADYDQQARADVVAA